jgi:hypothetical protein
MVASYRSPQTHGVLEVQLTSTTYLTKFMLHANNLLLHNMLKVPKLNIQIERRKVVPTFLTVYTIINNFLTFLIHLDRGLKLTRYPSPLTILWRAGDGEYIS